MKKEIKKAMGVSPVTGRIYYGNLRGDEWVGDKEDVTDTAVRAVFEWFIEKFEDVCAERASEKINRGRNARPDLCERKVWKVRKN